MDGATGCVVEGAEELELTTVGSVVDGATGSLEVLLPSAAGATVVTTFVGWGRGVDSRTSSSAEEEQAPTTSSIAKPDAHFLTTRSLVWHMHQDGRDPSVDRLR